MQSFDKSSFQSLDKFKFKFAPNRFQNSSLDNSLNKINLNFNTKNQNAIGGQSEKTHTTNKLNFEPLQNQSNEKLI